MLTLIETSDDRLLITDREDIESVIREAKEDLVEFEKPENGSVIKYFQENGLVTESTRSYILISTGYLKIEEACRP